MSLPSQNINGKRYHAIAADNTKAQADSRAKRYRKEGYLARVEKWEDGDRQIYYTFVHEKK